MAHAIPDSRSTSTDPLPYSLANPPNASDQDVLAVQVDTFRQACNDILSDSSTGSFDINTSIIAEGKCFPVPKAKLQGLP